MNDVEITNPNKITVKLISPTCAGVEHKSDAHAPRTCLAIGDRRSQLPRATKVTPNTGFPLAKLNGAKGKAELI